MEQSHVPTRWHMIETVERQPPHQPIVLASQALQVELLVSSPDVGWEGRSRSKPKSPPSHAASNTSGITYQESEKLMDEPSEDTASNIS